MKLDENSPGLKLEYPCQWIYKLIGYSRESIQKAIEETIQRKSYKIEPSNKSKKGKYCCMNLEIMVENEEDRKTIYTELKGHSNIIMVL